MKKNSRAARGRRHRQGWTNRLEHRAPPRGGWTFADVLLPGQRLMSSGQRPPLLRRCTRHSHDLWCDASLQDSFSVRHDLWSGDTSLHRQDSFSVRSAHEHLFSVRSFRFDDSRIPHATLSADAAAALKRARAACPICLEGYEVGQSVGCMPCGGLHKAHRECLTRWLARCPSCPTCRWDLRDAVATYCAVDSGSGSGRSVEELLCRGEAELRMLSHRGRTPPSPSTTPSTLSRRSSAEDNSNRTLAQKRSFDRVRGACPPPLRRAT